MNNDITGSNSSKTPTLSRVTTTPQSYGRGNLRVCRRGEGGGAPGAVLQDSGILLVALHRPAVRNAFNDDMYLDLLDLLHETSLDASIACIVLTGTGSYFSSGADLKSFKQNSNTSNEEESRRNTTMLQKPAGRFMMALLAYPKMICAAVQGPAVGIGVTLLLHCDLVHLSPNATLWIPFSRLALVPELCSSVVLRENMGLSKANELLLLGRKIDAQTAYEWNLCSRLVETAADTATDLDNPFHPNSLASRMAAEIQERLLSLPMSGQTVEYFCQLVKGGRRREILQQVCRNELSKLDERFHVGHVHAAARQLSIGSSSSAAHRQSHLQLQQLQHAPKSKL
jgi:enoyl-CoA hydratase/carnithine racemase